VTEPETSPEINAVRKQRNLRDITWPVTAQSRSISNTTRRETVSSSLVQVPTEWIIPRIEFFGSLIRV
jgi:hypothetical protein